MPDVALCLAVLVVCTFAVWSLLGRARRRKRQSRYEAGRATRATSDDHRNTIFVSMPCYCDEEEAALTLFSLFNAADCPWRISVGVLHHAPAAQVPHEIDATVHHTAAISDNIINRYEQQCRRHDATAFSANVRVWIPPVADAAGPVPARATIATHMFRRERYYMTIDSHMRFVASWDTKALAQHRDCQRHSPKPILTTWPATYDRDTQIPESRMPTFLAVSGTDRHGFPKVRPIPFDTPPVRPCLSPLWVGCFSFCSSAIVDEAPVDPRYCFLLWPEMYVRSARCWTHGWDFVVPSAPVCYHLADRKYRRTYWEQIELPGNRARHGHGVERALALLQRDRCAICRNPRNEHSPEHGLGHLFEPRDPEAASVHRRHGLGTERSRAAFERFCGVSVGGAPQPFVRAGCTATTGTEELVAKYGQVSTYRKLVASFEQA